MRIALCHVLCAIDREGVTKDLPFTMTGGHLVTASRSYSGSFLEIRADLPPPKKNERGNSVKMSM